MSAGHGGVRRGAGRGGERGAPGAGPGRAAGPRTWRRPRRAAGELPLGRAGRLLARVVPARPGRGRAGQGAGGGGAGASAGAARAGGAAGAGRAAVGGAARPGRPRAAGAAPAGQRVPQDRAPRAGAACCRGRCGSWWRSPPPSTGGGPVLDYERELRNVLAAVRAGPAGRRRRAGGAVRHRGGDPGGAGPRPGARAAHLPGTAPPARWSWRTRTARPGRSPPMSSRTGDPAGADAAGDQSCRPATPTRPAARTGASFAARLCQRGAAAVIATETSITDLYATRLLARLYGALAQARDPDIVAALAEARREVQARAGNLPGPAGQPSWPGWASGRRSPCWPRPGRCRSWTRSSTAPAAARAVAGRGSRGWPARADWYFVGRRAEQRRWPADLTGRHAGGDRDLRDRRDRQDHPGRRDHRPGPGPRARPGPGQPGRAADPGKPARRGDHHHPPRAAGPGGQDTRSRSGRWTSPARADLGWQDRLAILRGHVLDRVPVLLLLDNFEDNLRPDGEAGYAVGDEVLAGLLAAWVGRSGREPAAGHLPVPVHPARRRRSRRCRSGSWGRCPGPRR